MTWTRIRRSARAARFGDPKIEYFNVPILRNEEIVERPADRPPYARRFTEEAIAFMRENKARPFFVYGAQPARTPPSDHPHSRAAARAGCMAT